MPLSASLRRPIEPDLERDGYSLAEAVADDPIQKLEGSHARW